MPESESSRPCGPVQAVHFALRRAPSDLSVTGQARHATCCNFQKTGCAAARKNLKAFAVSAQFGIPNPMAAMLLCADGSCAWQACVPLRRQEGRPAACSCPRLRV